jgi:DNA-binding HxlR family transcriptional regulator
MVTEKAPALVRRSSAARALNLIGDRWTLLILYAAFMGVKRFDGFVTLTGIARSLLTDRLKRLEAGGVLERRLYQDRPPRYEYRLTAMGGTSMTRLWCCWAGRCAGASIPTARRTGSSTSPAASR